MWGFCEYQCVFLWVLLLAPLCTLLTRVFCLVKCLCVYLSHSVCFLLHVYLMLYGGAPLCTLLTRVFCLVKCLCVYLSHSVCFLLHVYLMLYGEVPLCTQLTRSRLRASRVYINVCVCVLLLVILDALWWGAPVHPTYARLSS